MRGRTSIKISLTSEQRETKAGSDDKTPVGLARTCRFEERLQTSERVGLGERHQVGRRFIERGVESCKTVPDRVESRFFPLKWRCIW